MIIDDARDIYEMSKKMRLDILNMGLKATNSGAHFGGSLSLVEIFAVLFKRIINISMEDPTWENRDRIVLSKGHGCMALYAAMKQMGLITEQELISFKSSNTWLSAHPIRSLAHRIEYTGGSLGQGLSFASGCALERRNIRFYVILGDGECNEGQVWEGAAFASHHKLNNITVIVDANGLQYDGPTREILDMEDMEKKWMAFGWDTVAVNGHDPIALLSALNTRNQARPLAVIAHTIKGKGVSFMENNPQWHHNILSQKKYNQALTDLEKQNV